MMNRWLHRVTVMIFVVTLMPIFAIAQCDSEAQARITAEHRLYDVSNKNYPNPDLAGSKRKFAETINSIHPRQIESAKQDGFLNRNNPQFKITTENRIAEHKEQISKSRRIQRNSQYEVDIASNERPIALALYEICRLGVSLQAASTNSPASTVQTHSQQSNQPPQTESESAQQQSQQAQQRATQNQARADQARQGKRRRHEPENVATDCIDPNFTGLYGGMKNSCGYKVWYTYCAYKPKPSSWLTGMDCEKQSFGTDLVGANRESAAHTKGAEMLYWFACKDPAWPVDSEFVLGQGVRSRCHTVGGN